MPPPKQVARSRPLHTGKESEEPRILANRYKIVRKLGSGSFGTVFLVYDIKNNNEPKVLKEIPVGDYEPDETIGAVTEARLLSKLHHPGIVKFHDSFIDGEYFCIITEFCEGGDLDVKLHSWKKAGKEVDTSLVLTWFIQLVLAVQYMHQRRVLHRDLKTRNVFLKNNMVKIGDFGISRILMGTTDIATTFTGTPYFMAPEILKHEGYNSKSDIWSLGVILHEMCTLKRAFDGNSLMGVMFKIVEGNIPPLPDTFDQQLHNIYSSMLTKDQAWRISASEILKKPFTIQYLEKLKIKMSNNYTLDRTKARRDTEEIAKVFTGKQKKKKEKRSAMERPLTPSEKLRLRKQNKADKEAEKLKKITISSYTENRKKYSQLKTRESKVSGVLPLTSNNNNDFSNDNDLNKPKVNVTKAPSDYTHCFGVDDSDEEDTPSQYTHCFGVESSEEDENEEVFEEEFPSLTDSFHLTNISDIPEDATLADSYYLTYEDFEDGSANSSSDSECKNTNEYGALVGCMENALDLTDSDVCSTFGDTYAGSSTLRQQKIDSLRRECIRLLGEECFNHVYHFLNKARFENSKSVNEDAIMNNLCKIVGNPRDCFLVDQLLFLEKQNEICMQSF